MSINNRSSIDVLITEIQTIKDRVKSTNYETLKQKKRVSIPSSLSELRSLVPRSAQLEVIYYQNKDKSNEVLAFGNLSEKGCLAESLAPLDKAWETCNKSELRYWFTLPFAFRPVKQESYWNDIAAGKLILPVIELERINDSVNIMLQWDGLCSVSDLEEAIETIKKQLIDSINTASRGVVDTHSVTDSTTYDEFEKILARIKKDFSNNTYKKIVVARERTYEIPADFDSVSLFQKMALQSKNSYEYFINDPSQKSFYGISPEMLFKRHSNKLSSEAIAGTRAGVQNSESLVKLKEEFENNPKDHLEHVFVLSMLLQRFEKCCTRFKVDYQPTILELPSMIHLQTKIEGTLFPDFKLSRIIDYLHPTPAVSGYPNIDIKPFIYEYEKIDRGLYSGVLGWIQGGSSEAIVMIRSALTAEQKIHLYSGVGLVPGSEPDKEWNELDLKIKTIETLIT